MSTSSSCAGPAPEPGAGRDDSPGGPEGMGAPANEPGRLAGEIARRAEEVVSVTCEGEGSAAFLRGPRHDPEAGWPPMELGESAPVEPFPVDVFPARVADFVRAASESIGCPADFVALPVLVVAGAAIGRSAALRLKPDYFASAPISTMRQNPLRRSNRPKAIIDGFSRPSGNWRMRTGGI